MRTKLILMSTLVALAGCQSSTEPSKANVYGSPVGQRVVGNKEGVMISNVWNELDAFPVAEKHCQQYGRSAKFKSSQGYRASFDCV